MGLGDKLRREVSRTRSRVEGELNRSGLRSPSQVGDDAFGRLMSERLSSGLTRAASFASLSGSSSRDKRLAGRLINPLAAAGARRGISNPDAGIEAGLQITGMPGINDPITISEEERAAENNVDAPARTAPTRTEFGATASDAMERARLNTLRRRLTGRGRLSTIATSPLGLTGSRTGTASASLIGETV